MKFKSLGPYCPRHQSWPPVSAKSSEDPSGEKRIKKGGSYRDVLFQRNSCPSSLKTSKLFGIIMQQPSTASDNDEIHHKPKTYAERLVLLAFSNIGNSVACSPIPTHSGRRLGNHTYNRCDILQILQSVQWQGWIEGSVPLLVPTNSAMQKSKAILWEPHISTVSPPLLSIVFYCYLRISEIGMEWYR